MRSICRKTKPETEFRLMKRKKGGARLYRNSYCRDCERWYMRVYMRQRREKSAHNEAATSRALGNKNNYILAYSGGNASGRENHNNNGRI